MKNIICLYGGPGTGKSTTAAHLFALLKQSDINAELITEYVKDWVWEGREIQPGDQYYLLAKQMRRERMKFKSVDVIVTDAPVWLACIYEELNEPKPHVCSMLINKHTEYAKQCGFEYRHIFLNRKKKYNPLGRHQNEEQAKEIDCMIKNHLINNGFSFGEIDADGLAAEKILNIMQGNNDTF